MADPQPLLIPRETLISTLQEKKNEAEAARQKATDEVAARRQALLDAVAKLTPDQWANFIDYHLNLAGEDAIRWAEEAVEKQKFVSEESKPTGVETTLDKLLRTLKLATNQEIEVYSSDPIYSYL